ncbi:MAG: DUF2384 domain-containing protein [Opitutaceae bacterium]|nr:DUF2384 domain-containing protein [Opitutaceae bacterium]
MSSTELFELAAQPTNVVVRKIRDGLPASSFTKLATTLGIPKNLLALKLGIAQRTINRRYKLHRVLSADASEKIVRIARIRNLARKLFTEDAAIYQWLNTPAPALDGSRPIDLLDTDVGVRDVEALIQGILFGNVI